MSKAQFVQWIPLLKEVIRKTRKHSITILCELNDPNMNDRNMNDPKSKASQKHSINGVEMIIVAYHKIIESKRRT